MRRLPVMVRALLVLATLANLVVLGRGSVDAHTAANYNPNKWPNPPIAWKFAPSSLRTRSAIEWRKPLGRGTPSRM
jgi:hypothetical protein